jgi:uncharacterized protein YfdQ (DUF2303 family)
MSEKTEAEAIRDHVASMTVLDVDSSGTPFVVIPEGHKLHDLEAMLESPRRVRQVVELATIESFVAYVQRFAEDGTTVFADESKRRLEAVLDYHAGEPRWCSHRAVFAATMSREAAAWFALDRKAMPQIEFAEFLEEHVGDVVEPAGAELLERALKLQFIQKAVFGSAVRLQSGEFQLAWSQENEKGTVELPEKIALGLPIFHRGDAYRLEARLRYRLNEGKVNFTYRLIERERAVEHAFAKIVERVKTELGADAQVIAGSRGAA